MTPLTLFTQVGREQAKGEQVKEDQNKLQLNREFFFFSNRQHESVTRVYTCIISFKLQFPQHEGIRFVIERWVKGTS